MKTEYTQTDIDRAWTWFREHEQHVRDLMALDRKSTYCFPMSGSDIGKPELWKPGGWNWFFAKIGFGDFIHD